MKKPDERKEDAQQRRQPRDTPFEGGDAKAQIVRLVVERERDPGAVGGPPEPPGRSGPGHSEAGRDHRVAGLPHRADEAVVVASLPALRSHAPIPPDPDFPGDTGQSPD